MQEPLPLATIHQQVLQFLSGRHDSAIFGAQAVNTYVEVPRMTQDVDVLSTCAEQLSQQLRDHLHSYFHIAVRVREVASGSGYRVYQVRTPKNRHLVDIRQIHGLPHCQTIGGLQVIAPIELIAMKVVSMVARPHTPKGLTDEADVLRLLSTFPELKSYEGPVIQALQRLSTDEKTTTTWKRLANQPIEPEREDDYYQAVSRQSSGSIQ